MTPEPECIRQEFGFLLQLHRTALGLSLHEVANSSGLTGCRVAAYENGDTDLTITDLVGLSAALDLSLIEIASRLQRRLAAKDPFNASKPSRSIALMMSNRGQQAVHAMARCENPEVVDALFDIIIASCMTKVSTKKPEEHATAI